MTHNKEFHIIKHSGLFDQEYYLCSYIDVKNAQVDPIEHFISYGWKEGRNPSAEFDTNFYLSLYPDVANSEINPLLHYIEHGRDEKRSIHNSYQSLSFQGVLLSKTITNLLQCNPHLDQTKNITIITPKHTLFIAHLLYNLLDKNNFNIQIITVLPETFDKHLYIVLCPQIFTKMPENYIAFQMEQLESSKWYNEHYSLILKQALAIFDYSLYNIEYLYKNHFSYKKLYHLPITNFPNYKQFLLHHNYWDGKNDNHQCDILFYGDPNSQRRRKYFDVLGGKFSIKIVNEIFGNELYHAILSAKVIVNIHYYENALLETTRIYECLSLGLKVVSEKSVDMEGHPNLLNIVDFVDIGNIDQMVHALEELLHSNHKISVIIPCYNQAPYLTEAVESIVSQTYSNIEIIIVNDGSTDNTYEVAKQLISIYPHFGIKLINQKNMGLSQARNSGIRVANGEFIVPMDADDKLHPQMILSAMQTIKKYNADIVYGDYQRFGENTTVQKTRDSVELYDIQYANVTGATALYKKKVWEAAGGYKKNMHGGYEDWEFWVNATKLGFKFYHISQILFYYRVKKESMYTESVKKHTYLCSKVIMNHPELYTDREIDNAINSIRQYENNATLYFYVDKNLSYDDKDLITGIGEYIDKHNLYKLLYAQKQISIPSFCDFGSVTLYNLKEIASEEELDHIKLYSGGLCMFYSEIRYDPHTLKSGWLKEAAYGWHKEKGSILPEGTAFPLSSKGDLTTRLEAYNRSERYFHEYYQ